MTEHLKQQAEEQKKALLAVWAVVSVIFAVILLLPFFAGRQAILEHTPVCLSKSQFNAECLLCGMTRAFIEITQGHFSAATSFNKGSIALFSVFALISISFTGMIFKRFINSLK